MEPGDLRDAAILARDAVAGQRRNQFGVVWAELAELAERAWK
jgi:hypothetical protein